MNRNESFDGLLSRASWSALAVLLLTTVHHVYGAVVYHTPWRLHVGFVSVFAAAAIVLSQQVLRRGSGPALRRLAFSVFVGTMALIPVLLIGLFEGGYNHVLKNVLYFAGAPATLLSRLFPPPTYEMPNDVFFEVTGVMQLVAGCITGWLLVRLLRMRTIGSSAPAPSSAAGIREA